MIHLMLFLNFQISKIQIKKKKKKVLKTLVIVEFKLNKNKILFCIKMLLILTEMLLLFIFEKKELFNVLLYVL